MSSNKLDMPKIGLGLGCLLFLFGPLIVFILFAMLRSKPKFNCSDYRLITLCTSDIKMKGNSHSSPDSHRFFWYIPTEDTTVRVGHRVLSETLSLDYLTEGINIQIGNELFLNSKENINICREVYVDNNYLVRIIPPCEVNQIIYHDEPE